MNSWLHNLASLSKGRDRCTLQVCPKDAQALGLLDGGRAELEGRVGRLLVSVAVSDRMAPGVVSLPHGFGHDLPGVELGVARRKPGGNANIVVDDADLDVPSGTSVLNGVRVRVRPVPGLWTRRVLSVGAGSMPLGGFSARFERRRVSPLGFRA